MQAQALGVPSVDVLEETNGKRSRGSIRGRCVAGQRKYRSRRFRGRAAAHCLVVAGSVSADGRAGGMPVAGAQLPLREPIQGGLGSGIEVARAWMACW